MVARDYIDLPPCRPHSLLISGVLRPPLLVEQSRQLTRRLGVGQLLTYSKLGSTPVAGARSIFALVSGP